MEAGAIGKRGGGRGLLRGDLCGGGGGGGVMFGIGCVFEVKGREWNQGWEEVQGDH